jgi:hypothetical protein
LQGDRAEQLAGALVLHGPRGVRAGAPVHPPGEPDADVLEGDLAEAVPEPDLVVAQGGEHVVGVLDAPGAQPQPAHGELDGVHAAIVPHGRRRVRGR